VGFEGGIRFEQGGFRFGRLLLFNQGLPDGGLGGTDPDTFWIALRH
jgi:hypothetical protein